MKKVFLWTGCADVLIDVKIHTEAQSRCETNVHLWCIRRHCVTDGIILRDGSDDVVTRIA